MRTAATLLATAALLPLFACGEPAPPPAPEAERVENPALGLAIAALPEPFEVVNASGDTIELTAPGANGPGTAVLSVGEPSNSGINLVEATKARQAAFEIADGGKFFGTRSLGGALGNVFTARGSLLQDGVEVEQTWAFALHPTDKNRMLTITYSYPTGESQERVNQFLYLLGEIEGIVPTAGEPL